MMRYFGCLNDCAKRHYARYDTETHIISDVAVAADWLPAGNAVSIGNDAMLDNYLGTSYREMTVQELAYYLYGHPPSLAVAEGL